MRAPLLVAALLVAGCVTSTPPNDAPANRTPGNLTPPDEGDDVLPPPPDWPYQAGTLDGARAAAEDDVGTSVGDLRPAWTFETEGAVTGTPTVWMQHVYVATWKGKVYALALATGEEAWSADVGAQVDASVTLWRGTAFVGDATATLHALDAATGAPKWARKVDDQVRAHLYATPLVLERDGRAVLVMPVASDQESARIHGDAPVDFRASVVGLDPEDGRELWRTWLVPEGTTGAPVWGSAVYDEVNDVVLFGTGNAYTEPATEMTDSVVAMSPWGGEITWSFQATKDDVFTQKDPESPDADFGATGAVYSTEDGRRLFAIGQKSSVVWALDVATGEVAWRRGKAQPGEGVIGDSAFLDGVLVVPSILGFNVTGYDGATGDRLWTSAFGAPVFSDPALAPGVAFAADTSGTIRALDLRSGEVLWNGTAPEGAAVYGGLSLVEGRLLVPLVADGFLGEKGGVAAYRAG